jgi:hypothetical protein
MHQARQSAVSLVIIIILVVGAAGCDSAKSENPLSPSVAGPIAGVSITTPALLDPPANKQIAVADLPVKLTIQNSTTTGQRPVAYVFEVATDNAFASKILTSGGITPGSNGQTTFVVVNVPLEAGKTYFWRAKADDGANQSAFADPRAFSVYVLSISVPALVTPQYGQEVAPPPVRFTIQNSTTTGERPLTYIIDIATDLAFGSTVYTTGPGGTPPGSNGQTSIVVDKPLEAGRYYYWRAKATDGSAQSAYSAVNKFLVSSVTAPPPSPGPPPGPAANDAIDLSTVIWVKGVNTSRWAVTSTMISVSYDAAHESLCLEHTAQGKWPRLNFLGDPANGYVEASQIIMANIGGQWYAGAADWLRPGNACAHVPSNIGPAKFPAEPPLSGWIPSPGEMVGFMVTTPSRLGQQGTAERSNVVLYQWR